MGKVLIRGRCENEVSEGRDFTVVSETILMTLGSYSFLVLLSKKKTVIKFLNRGSRPSSHHEDIESFMVLPKITRHLI